MKCVRARACDVDFTVALLVPCSVGLVLISSGSRILSGFRPGTLGALGITRVPAGAQTLRSGRMPWMHRPRVS